MVRYLDAVIAPMLPAIGPPLVPKSEPAMLPRPHLASLGGFRVGRHLAIAGGRPVVGLDARRGGLDARWAALKEAWGEYRRESGHLVLTWVVAGEVATLL